MARRPPAQSSGPLIVVDNGGGTIKLGLGGQDVPVKVFTNAAARIKGERKVVWGETLDDLPDIASITLQHPIDRGYVVNWDLQRQIWDHSIRSQLHVQPSEASLLVTEPVFNFPTCQEACLQVVFEEMGMQGLAVATGPDLVLRQHLKQSPAAPFHTAQAGLVVDAGFSFIHVVPFLDGQALQSGIRRIDLGGKFMTNYLKELVSFRSLNMMDEAYLVEHVKQAACFVSQDLPADLRAAKGSSSPHKAEYVLPDGLSASRGFLRPPQPRSREQQEKQEQVLQLNNERFLVPELAFSPSDIGLKQGGIAQQVADAALSQHPDIQPLLLSNVVCAGGLAACPGFATRLQLELRPLIPDHIEVLVHTFEQPQLAAWQGGSDLAVSPDLATRFISKADYQEAGARDWG